MMQGVRVILRRSQVVRRCSTFRQPPPSSHHRPCGRMFSAVPNTAPLIMEEPPSADCDFIRDAIKKLTKKEDSDVKRPPITDDELNKRIQKFQSLVKEAHLCIADCEDCASSEIREEESKAAEVAVEEAFSAYIDLLDDFRRVDEKQLQRFTEERMHCAAMLKHLRQELHCVYSST